MHNTRHGSLPEPQLSRSLDMKGNWGDWIVFFAVSFTRKDAKRNRTKFLLPYLTQFHELALHVIANSIKLKRGHFYMF